MLDKQDACPDETGSPQRVRPAADWKPVLLAPLIHPVVDSLVPEPAVLRLEHPMAFVREIQELRRNLQSLQSREELKSFAHVEPIIVLAMNHQRRRFEFVGEYVR